MKDDNINNNSYKLKTLKIYMDDETKGEEKRKILFKKISPIVLDIIEKRIHIDILDYDVREILMKYLQQAQYFAEEKVDAEIFLYFIAIYHGQKENDILPLADYFDDGMIRLFALRGYDIFE